MQHLQGQFISQEAGATGLSAASPHHRGFQPLITGEQGQLTVGIERIVAHLQQLIPQQGLTDGRGVEGAIPHHLAL